MYNMFEGVHIRCNNLLLHLFYDHCKVTFVIYDLSKPPGLPSMVSTLHCLYLFPILYQLQ